MEGVFETTTNNFVEVDMRVDLVEVSTTVMIRLK